MKTVTYTEIDSYELEGLIKEHLGIDYDGFVADLECGNDSKHTFDMAIYKFGGENNDQFETGYRHEIKEYEEYGENQYARPAYYIAKLVEKGVLPEGKILVSVCW